MARKRKIRASLLRRAKPHPPFGATAAQAKRHQEIRDLKNRIFELEHDIETALVSALEQGRKLDATTADRDATRKNYLDLMAKLKSSGVGMSESENRILITTTPPVMGVIRALAETGFYGASVAAVAEELLRTAARLTVARTVSQ